MPGGALFLRFLGVPVRPRQDATQRRRPREQLHAAASPPADGGAGVEQAPHAGAHEAEDAVAAAKQAGVPVPGTLGVAAVLSGARNWGFLFKALTVHGASVAAQLAARPLAPLHDTLQRQLERTAAVQAAVRGAGTGGAGHWAGCRVARDHPAACAHTTQGSPPLPLPPVQCRQLQVGSLAELQDLMNCVLLSETVYKVA